MADPRLPGRDEVLAWIERTGQSYRQAVAHFADQVAGLSDKERERFTNRCRTWVNRARAKQAEPPGADIVELRTVPPPVDRERERAPATPRGDVADLGRVEFWRQQVAELAGDIAQCRADEQPSRIPPLQRELRAARDALDLAIAEQPEESLADLPEEEFERRFRMQAAEWPETYLRWIIEEWEHRHRVTVRWDPVRETR